MRADVQGLLRLADAQRDTLLRDAELPEVTVALVLLADAYRRDVNGAHGVGETDIERARRLAG